MRDTGISLHDVIVIVVGVAILAILAVLLWPGGGDQGWGHPPVCMSNLKCIGSALTLYLGQNDNQWPWMGDRITGWDRNRVGLNRGASPYADPNNPGERSITALMFLLIRENQPVKLFVCPSTTETKDEVIVDANKEQDEPAYYWDFSSHRNISYSWQAPILGKGGRFRQGLSDQDNDAAVMSDKTPNEGPEKWPVSEWSPDLKGAKVEPHNSQNHSRGKQNNVLYVGMNVAKSDRPDIGVDRDMIFTASGDPNRGSATSRSLSIRDHLSPRDSFLIGPVSGQDVNSPAGR